MAAVASSVDICNLALDDLKQPPIKSITTPNSATEYICARRYDTVRRECLFAHPWKFAIFRIQLTPDPSYTIPFGYAYAYKLPADYLRIISKGDDYLGDMKSDYVIEDNYLFAVSGDLVFDGTTIDVRYMRDVIDVTKFSPGFVTYLELKLALRMSNKFSISNTIKAGLKEDFKDAETEARAINGMEGRIKRVQQSRVLMKRRGLPGGLYASPLTVFGS